jgi:hypothetical protein
MPEHAVTYPMQVCLEQCEPYRRWAAQCKLNGVRYAMIAFGSVLLILSIVRILRQPRLPY